METEEELELTEEEVEFANKIKSELHDNSIDIFDFIPISIFREIVKDFDNKILLGNSEKNPKGLLSKLKNSDVKHIKNYKNYFE